MKLESGTRLGPYEIQSTIGAGGMGEIYRARDTRLDRAVAVKVLAQHLSLTAEVRERFEREARTISSLSHPNICTLYDVGREGDTDFLVMELLDGKSLAQRLESGPLPLGEVLRLGVQIADALEKAHASGVVHRDLKPGNIMLTERGVKLLDFGLAKLQAQATSPSSATELRQLPTAAGTGPLTAEGTLLGTFQYMAPEQLEGHEANAASDIFALGAVLYEMATGRKAFAGASQASLIGAIMHEAPPPVSSLAALSPPAFDRVVATCLAKDPRDRWQTAHDVRLQLAWIAEGGSMVGLPAPLVAQRKQRERLAWMLAGTLALVAAGFAYGFVRRAPEPPRVVRFQIRQPADLVDTGAPKISPDGSQIAFVGADAKGATQVWLRALEAIDARPLPGTDGIDLGSRPFWSPDSRYVAFFLGTKLMKVPVDGGPAQKIADAPVTGGDGTWSEQGIILFDGTVGDPLHRVEAAGGVPRPLALGAAARPGEEVTAGWPQFLPGGDKFVYVIVAGSEEQQGLYLSDLDGGTPRKLLDGISRADLAPPASLIFVRDGTLVAQRFDPAKGTLVGDPVPLAEGLGVDDVGLADFSAARNDTLVYRPAPTAAADRLAWLDKAGSRLTTTDDPGDGQNPDLSPDGRWLAVQRVDGTQQDIWLRDLRRGVSSRLTTDPARESNPLFTPDGRGILFSREGASGDRTIFERSLDSGQEREVVPAAERATALAVTPDGRRLLYATRRTVGSQQPFDLLVTDLAAGGAGTPYAASDFSEYGGSFSPDGRWLAFASNQSGRAEVYVQGFPEAGRRFQVSTEGGREAVWAPSGTHIDYVSPDNELMRVEVTTSPAFDAGIPKALFPLPLAPIASRNLLVFSPDGERLLVVTPTGPAAENPSTVVLNWSAALRR